MRTLLRQDGAELILIVGKQGPGLPLQGAKEVPDAL